MWTVNKYNHWDSVKPRLLCWDWPEVLIRVVKLQTSTQYHLTPLIFSFNCRHVRVNLRNSSPFKSSDRFTIYSFSSSYTSDPTHCGKWRQISIKRHLSVVWLPWQCEEFLKYQMGNCSPVKSVVSHRDLYDTAETCEDVRCWKTCLMYNMCFYHSHWGKTVNLSLCFTGYLCLCISQNWYFCLFLCLSVSLWVSV